MDVVLLINLFVFIIIVIIGINIYVIIFNLLIVPNFRRGICNYTRSIPRLSSC